MTTQLQEFEDVDSLGEGSIVAVIAPDDVFWIACLAAAAGTSRWSGTWLEEIPRKGKRVNGTISYRIADGYDEATVWIDNIICDISHIIQQEGSNLWSLPFATVQHLNGMVERHKQLPPQRKAICQLPNATVQPRKMLTWDEQTIRTLAKKCNPALKLVRTHHFCVIFNHYHILI